MQTYLKMMGLPPAPVPTPDPSCNARSPPTLKSESDHSIRTIQLYCMVWYGMVWYGNITVLYVTYEKSSILLPTCDPPTPAPMGDDYEIYLLFLLYLQFWTVGADFRISYTVYWDWTSAARGGAVGIQLGIHFLHRSLVKVSRDDRLVGKVSS